MGPKGSSCVRCRYGQPRHRVKTRGNVYGYHERVGQCFCCFAGGRIQRGGGRGGDEVWTSAIHVHWGRRRVIYGRFPRVPLKINVGEFIKCKRKKYFQKKTPKKKKKKKKKK